MFWESSVLIIRSYLLYARQLLSSMQAMWPLPSRDRLERKIYFAIKLYMFRASCVPIIRSYLLYARQLVRFMKAVPTCLC